MQDAVWFQVRGSGFDGGMNMNDGRQRVFTSAHISYRHRGKCSAVFTQPNMEHRRMCCSRCVRGWLRIFICVCLCAYRRIKNERPVRDNERWRETVIETLGSGRRKLGENRKGEQRNTPCAFSFLAWMEAAGLSRERQRERRGLPTSCFVFSHILCLVDTLHTVRIYKWMT